MANYGGFLQALGQAFGGYAQDEQTRQQRAAAAQKVAMEQQQAAREAAFQQAQIGNWNADNARQQQVAQRGLDNQKSIADSWDAALNGDRQAQARIVAVAPELAPHFMPKPQEPKRTYDSTRGVMIDETTGQAVPIRGLPQVPKEQKGPVEGTPEYYDFLKRKLAIEQDFKTPEGPKATDFSNKAALVYPKAEQAAKVLDKYFTEGAPARSMLGKIPLVGNYALTGDEQAMNQAAETVAAAILRLESGASISESEIKGAAKQFLPQPGDTPEVRAQKRQTLATQLEQMRGAAAPSMPAAARSATSGPPARTNAPQIPTPSGFTPNDARQPGRLSPAQLKRASTDSLYRQFLKDTGKLR